MQQKNKKTILHLAERVNVCNSIGFDSKMNTFFRSDHE